MNLVWAWGDLMNALQIFPNLIGVIALSGIAAKAAYDRRTSDAVARRIARSTSHHS